jgi:hypothetical protein
MAQNEAQRIYCQNKCIILAVEKIQKNVVFFCNVKKLTNVNFHPMGENWPNLVTLTLTQNQQIRFGLCVHT